MPAPPTRPRLSKVPPPPHPAPNPARSRLVRTDPSTLTVGRTGSGARWSAPFATRLDVDTLEDLVEGGGGFITDRHVNPTQQQYVPFEA